LTPIVVDIAALADMATRLRALRAEFEGMGNTVHGFEEAVGNHEVSERLGAFATNWSEKREKIAKLIDDIANYADAAAQRYAEQEGDVVSHVNRLAGG